MIAEERLTPEDVARLHAQFGVAPERLAQGVTENTRRELEIKTRIYCLSARNTDSGMCGLYAGLNGVCLHFAAILARYSEIRVASYIRPRANRS